MNAEHSVFCMNGSEMNGPCVRDFLGRVASAKQGANTPSIGLGAFWRAGPSVRRRAILCR